MRLSLVLIILISTICPIAHAEDLLAYNSISLKPFGRIRFIIPKNPAQNRVYLKVKCKEPLVQAVALLDNRTLIRPVGNLQTTSVPAELAQQFGRDFRNIFSFPRAAFQPVGQSIVFGLETDNGKATRVHLHGKTLARVWSELYPSELHPSFQSQPGKPHDPAIR